MPFEIAHTKDHLIIFTFRGEVGYAENMDVMNEVFQLSEKLGTDRMIMDWRAGSLSTKMTAEESVKCGKLWPIAASGEPFKVAMVLSRTRASEYQAIDMMVTIARRDGLISKMFWEMDDAVRWVLQVRDLSQNR